MQYMCIDTYDYLKQFSKNMPSTRFINQPIKSINLVHMLVVCLAKFISHLEFLGPWSPISVQKTDMMITAQNLFY